MLFAVKEMRGEESEERQNGCTVQYLVSLAIVVNYLSALFNADGMRESLAIQLLRQILINATRPGK